jgi:hypothetical protein
MATYRRLGWESQKATGHIKAVRVFDIAGSDDHRFNNRAVAFCKVRCDAAAAQAARGAVS